MAPDGWSSSTRSAASPASRSAACWACVESSLLRRADVTVGASASIFGFLGALVHYGRRTGSSHIGQAGLQYALFMGIMGFIFRGVDNAAHLGGFVGGYLASMILDPLKPERVDHIADRGRLPGRDAAAIIYTVISACTSLSSLNWILASARLKNRADRLRTPSSCRVTADIAHGTNAHVRAV